ncbi:MAG: phosphatidylglycerol:prolipoprotein diacylglycerol transferase [Planctomycetota bacterium]|jgi:phosphatidylglycerol:prolipoprotein diacylglycerol transferase|uniref:prolipoprotein diacylglyceryl transferase n=1 Tax=Patiriisocius sp. Uisw_047 TaxID=3230969 RepID=UPI0039EC0BEE
MHFSSFFWDPSEGIDLGFFVIRYYSLMFVLAFTLGWFITKRIFDREKLAQEKLDSLFIYMVLAILLGARMGHVIFYQPELITQDFFSVFLPFSFVPEFEYTGFQGLASHGAAIGVIISMFIYSKKVLKRPVLWILDRVVIAVASGAIFVRIGNFINSEIIGKATGSDFGVVFTQLGENFTRHPAQLYEAGGYVFVFLILWFIYWKTDKRQYLGFLFGSFLILLWLVRFFVEFIKEAQVDERADWVLNTGQWLSIPFILFGTYMVYASSKKKYNTEE